MKHLLNTITVGDARELAQQIPDNSIDLIFTDPYAFSSTQSCDKTNGKESKGLLSSQCDYHSDLHFCGVSGDFLLNHIEYIYPLPASYDKPALGYMHRADTWDYSPLANLDCACSHLGYVLAAHQILNGECRTFQHGLAQHQQSIHKSLRCLQGAFAGPDSSDEGHLLKWVLDAYFLHFVLGHYIMTEEVSQCQMEK